MVAHAVTLRRPPRGAQGLTGGQPAFLVVFLRAAGLAAPSDDAFEAGFDADLAAGFDVEAFADADFAEDFAAGF